MEGESVAHGTRERPRAPSAPASAGALGHADARACCVPFGARVDAGLLSERPARGRWQIDATCQRYGCKFIATSAKEDKVNGKCQEAVDVASILSAYPQCRYP